MDYSKKNLIIIPVYNEDKYIKEDLVKVPKDRYEIRNFTRDIEKDIEFKLNKDEEILKFKEVFKEYKYSYFIYPETLNFNKFLNENIIISYSRDIT